MAVGIISPPKTKAQGASGLQNAAMVMGLVGGLADLSTSVQKWAGSGGGTSGTLSAASPTGEVPLPSQGEIQKAAGSTGKDVYSEMLTKQLAQSKAQRDWLASQGKNPFDSWGNKGVTRVK